MRNCKAPTESRRCGGRRRDLPRCRWAVAEPGRQHTNDKHRPIGGRRGACGAWPDNESTRRAAPSTPGAAGVEGAGGICRGAGGRWRSLADSTLTTSTDRLEAAAGPAGPGRASSRRAERSSLRGRRAGGQATRRPEICRGRRLACGDLAGGRARRRPEHQRGNKHRRRVRTPRSTPDSGRPGGRRGGRAR